jgi:hypothetical protein
MNSYKALLNNSQAAIDATKRLLAQVKESSKKAENPGTYYAAHRNEQLNILARDLKLNSDERFKSIISQMANARDGYDAVVSGQVKDVRADARTYHSQRAARAISRGSVEDAINTYNRLVNGLRGDERKYRIEYDAELLERVSFEEPTSMIAAEKVIDNHRSPEEQDALKEMRLADGMLYHHKTADALINQQLENLRDSGDCVDYDWEKIYDEMLQTANNQPRVEPEPIEVRINPTNPYEDIEGNTPADN